MLSRMLIVTSQVFPTSILPGRRNGKSLLLFLHHVSKLNPLICQMNLTGIFSFVCQWYFGTFFRGTSSNKSIGRSKLLQVHLYGIQPAPSDRRVNEFRALQGKIIVAVTTKKRQGSSTFYLPRHRIHPALDHAGCFPGH